MSAQFSGLFVEMPQAAMTFHAPVKSPPESFGVLAQNPSAV
jgi:hypothetical protein